MELHTPRNIINTIMITNKKTEAKNGLIFLIKLTVLGLIALILAYVQR